MNLRDLVRKPYKHPHMSHDAQRVLRMLQTQSRPVTARFMQVYTGINRFLIIRAIFDEIRERGYVIESVFDGERRRYKLKEGR